MKILDLLFGPSWKTSLLSLAGGALLALTTYLQGAQDQGLVWYAAAVGVVLLGRFLPDAAPGGKSIKEILLGTSPASTLLGALAPVLASVATFAQGQQGMGWYVIALIIPAVLRFAKVPGIDKSGAPAAAPSGFSILPVLPALAAVAILATWLLAPVCARAQEPGATLTVCLSTSCSYSLQTGAAFTGTMYTKTEQGVQVARNVQVAELAVLNTPWPVDPVAGPAWQTGTAQGWGGTAGVTEKRSGVGGTVLASCLVVGGKPTWAVGLGTLARF